MSENPVPPEEAPPEQHALESQPPPEQQIPPEPLVPPGPQPPHDLPLAPGPPNLTTQTVGDVDADGDVNFIGAFYQIFDTGEVASVPRVFSGGGRIFTNRQEAEIQRYFVGDDDAIERMLRELERSRILVICGDRAIGKMTTALYVATRLAEQNDLPRCTRIVDPLDRAVRVHLHKIAAEPARLGGRVTVLVDAFDRENRDLLRFFARLDRAGAEQLAEALHRNGSYLILTASTSDMTRVASTIARHEIAPVTKETVARGFDRKLNLIRERNAAAGERISILSAERDRIIEKLETIPAVSLFIEHFASRTEEIETALQNFNDTGAWLQEVTRDFDAWCFVLTLALAYPTADAEAAPWLDFDHLRRMLTSHLRKCGEFLTRELGPNAESGTEERQCAQTLVDDALFERCRAVIAKDSDHLGDVVRFRDRGCGSDVWKSLLMHNRRALTQVVPILLRIAVDERSASRAWLRMVATRALGRIGEIDPIRLTIPQIRRWAGSGEKNDRPLVGRLVQGALYSTNATYREATLREIAALADPATAYNAAGAGNRLLTAISAYSQIGVYVPAYAMMRLGMIAIEHVAPMVHNISVIARLAETANRHAAESQHAGRAAALQERRNRLASLAHHLSADHAPAAMALEKAIVYLCVVTDSVQTLAATREWISKGGAPTGILMAVLFLLDGIAADLQALTLETADGTPASPLLISLASGSEAVEQFSGLLADIRGAISSTTTLPAGLQRTFHQRFAEMLTSLATDAVAGQYRAAVADLFVQLAQVRGRAFRHEIYALVGTPPFDDKSNMHTFAVEVRKRITG